MGPVLQKPALEADHSPIALHVDPIKSCFIKDDLHVTVHFRSKGHLLTTALMEIQRSRPERLLLLYAENGHEIILAV